MEDENGCGVIVSTFAGKEEGQLRRVRATNEVHDRGREYWAAQGLGGWCMRYQIFLLIVRKVSSGDNCRGKVIARVSSSG